MHPVRKLYLGCCLFMASAIIGCASVGAWMGELSVSKDGTVRGTAEAAGPGGDFHKNTGLNLSAGDNSLVALTIAGITLVVMPFVYPAQRALRIRRERSAIEHHERTRGGGTGSNGSNGV